MTHNRYWALIFGLTLALIIVGSMFSMKYPVTTCMLGVLFLFAFVEYLRRIGLEETRQQVNGIVTRDLCPNCGASLINNICYYDSYMCIDCELGTKVKH